MSFHLDFSVRSPQRRKMQRSFPGFHSKSLGSSLNRAPLTRAYTYNGISQQFRKGSGFVQGSGGSILGGVSDGLERSQIAGSGASNSNEKELLRSLNDRFAGFKERVRQLESQNKDLENEISELRRKQLQPSQVAERFEPEIRELRQLITQVTCEKAQVDFEYHHLNEDFQILRSRYEKEAHRREKIEDSITALKRCIQEAQMVKLQLEKKVQALIEEAVFLKDNHQEEVEELSSQIQEAHVSVEEKVLLRSDAVDALRDVRVQLDSQSNRRLQEVEDSFRSRIDQLTKIAETNNEVLQATKQEIKEYRRHLQSKNIEFEAIRGHKGSLEKQLSDLEERHDVELSQYQVRSSRVCFACIRFAVASVCACLYN
nr:PREDICTED: neurofilament medium polypeptide-like [Latimeria chalumnae]|eukprot:XP_006005102.1 PREDICTED: neurofilament medium polypeptide-like [Latimeria chalumnae]